MTINTMMLLFVVWVLLAIVLSLVIARFFGAASRGDAKARRRQAQQALQSAATEPSSESRADSNEPRRASGGN